MKPIENTAPLVNEQGQKLTRQFLGKTENFEDNYERNFYGKMLKSYLKGGDIFYYGKHLDGKPKGFHVQQQYSYR